MGAEEPVKVRAEGLDRVIPSIQDERRLLEHMRGVERWHRAHRDAARGVHGSLGDEWSVVVESTGEHYVVWGALHVAHGFAVRMSRAHVGRIRVALKTPPTVHSVD